MTSESLEQLRQRLLRDDSVQQMIRARAYEIFLMRGLQAGGPAQDWFQAETEVLAFLLANQPEQPIAEVLEQPASSQNVDAPSEPTTPKKTRKPRSTSSRPAKKTAARRTGSQKSAQSESKPKRTRKKSKSEDESA